MARPKKLTRDPDKKPRSYAEILEIHRSANELYAMIGGASIDLQIAAMDRTQGNYTQQMDFASQYGKDIGAYGPNVTPYEARMTAATAAKLHKLREQKMQQCILLAEEAAEHAALEAAEKDAAVVQEAATPPAAVVEPAPAVESRPAAEPAPQAKPAEPMTANPAAARPDCDVAGVHDRKASAVTEHRREPVLAA